MQAEVLVVFADAVFDDDVVADLPGDAVTVVVAGGDAADVDAVTVLDEDATGVVAIEFGVVRAVAIEHEVFDAQVLSPSPMRWTPLCR